MSEAKFHLPPPTPDMPAWMRVNLGMKQCPQCDQRLPLEAFTPNLRYAKRVSSWCRACTAERMRAHRQRQREDQR